MKLKSEMLYMLHEIYGNTCVCNCLFYKESGSIIQIVLPNSICAHIKTEKVIFDFILAIKYDFQLISHMAFIV